jgi:hypothetical protein
MQYFDSKEEVLDIELTQYGRYLLSQGVWKPHYYAFFDENVIYDSQYAGPTENKNDIEKRIQDETPLLKTQATFTGRDEYLYDGVGDEDERSALGLYEKHNVLPYYLGNSSLESTKTPAYKIQFLEGKVKELQYNLTGNLRTELTGTSTRSNYSQQLLKIPQIESQVEFKISVADPEEVFTKFEISPALTPGRIYKDNTIVVVGPEQILLAVEEQNSSFDYKNFDIEIFEIVSGSTGPLGEETLAPLSFIKPIEMVKDNLLLDRKEANLLAGRIGGLSPELDPTYVEYYFNINVDEEIDRNVICKAISELKSDDFLVDIDIECPDLATPFESDIYASDSTSEDCPDY